MEPPLSSPSYYVSGRRVLEDAAGTELSGQRVSEEEGNRREVRRTIRKRSKGTERKRETGGGEENEEKE